MGLTREVGMSENIENILASALENILWTPPNERYSKIFSRVLWVVQGELIEDVLNN